MRILMMVFYLLLIVIGIGFAALNAKMTVIDFYLTSLKLPVSVFMILMLGLGIVIGFFLFMGRYWRLKAECHRIKNQLKLTEKEIRNLRAIPLHDQH